MSRCRLFPLIGLAALLCVAVSSVQAGTTTGELYGDDAAFACHANLEKCQQGQPCGDLTVDKARLQASARVDTIQMNADSCAVVEGCSDSGLRTVLRFDMATPNVGDRDIYIGSPGVPSLKDCFVWSPCHAHYHFQGFAQYYLQDRFGSVVARGHKSSSCLQDAIRTPNSTAPVIPDDELSTCARQGIHVGYQDVYGAHLDCQWIDITGIPAGNYYLTVSVNTQGIIPELNWENNDVMVPVVIPEGQHNPSPLPTSCEQQGGCDSCAKTTGCGWCATTAYCAYGTFAGPSNGVCQSNGWVWSAAQCSQIPPPLPEPEPESSSSSSTGADEPVIDLSSTGVPDPTDPLGSTGVDIPLDSSTGLPNTAPDTPGKPTDPNNPDGTGSSTGTGEPNTCPAGQVRVPRSAIAPTSVCDGLDSCGLCADVEGCGWCGHTRKCTAGSSVGPKAGSCPDTWQFGASNTCGNCQQYSSCSQCTAAVGCGFCAATSTCSQGSWLGPSSGACTAWNWGASQCPAPAVSKVSKKAVVAADCSAATTCDSCTALSGCGFCLSEMGGVENLCTKGHFMGPKQGKCKKWVWAQATCPATNTVTGQDKHGPAIYHPRDPKAAVVTVTNPKSAATVQHKEVVSTKPLPAITPKLPPATACSALTTCVTCALNTQCGWSTASNQCSEGSYEGSNTETTGEGEWKWSATSCVAPPPSAELVCNTQKDCASCAGVRGCGWCATTATCSYGDFLAPRASTCPTWVWSAQTCSSTLLTARLKGEAPGHWAPLVDDASISEDIKSWNSTLSDILKMDQLGNIFKNDPVNAGFKKDYFGNFLKESKADIDLHAVIAQGQSNLGGLQRSSKRSSSKFAQSPNPSYGRKRTAVVSATDDSSMDGMDMASGSMSATSDVRPPFFYDMYDPFPLDPRFPHGHMEMMHMSMGDATVTSSSRMSGAASLAADDSVCMPGPQDSNTPITPSGSAVGLTCAPAQLMTLMAAALLIVRRI